MRAMDPFLDHGDPDRIILVIPSEDADFIAKTLEEELPGAKALLVPGGASRQESVYRGLSAIADDEANVAIHDAARPLFDGADLPDWISTLDEFPALLPVLPVHDTILEVEGDRATKRLNREKLAAVQTPQLFRLSLIRRAHRWALERDIRDASDDGSLLLAMGEELHTVKGDPLNRKITLAEDFEWAEAMLKERE